MGRGWVGEWVRGGMEVVEEIWGSGQGLMSSYHEIKSILKGKSLSEAEFEFLIPGRARAAGACIDYHARV